MAIRTALRQGFALTRSQARACGISDARLRRLVRQGEWTPCGRGVIALVAIRSDLPEYETARRRHVLSAAAACLTHQGHVLTGRSAAVVHGLPTLAVPTRVELLAAAGHATFGRQARIQVRAGDPAERVTGWLGVALRDPASTVVDLARFDRRDALMAADAALHAGLITRGDLDQALAQATGRYGIRQARAVLALANSLIESPLESLTHLALNDAGAPPPEPQAPITAINGRIYWVDFYWPQLRLVIEVDGRDKYDDDERWREKRRSVALIASHYQVIRLTWSDVVENWPATWAWLRLAFPDPTP